MNESVVNHNMYCDKYKISVNGTLIITALATFKNVYNYYILLIPEMKFVFVVLYNIITLYFLIIYIPLFLFVLRNIRKKEFKIYIPAIVIPLSVILNIISVMFKEGSISIISREYFLQEASETNDCIGFYFSQVNTWFTNMAILLSLSLKIKNKKEIINCIIVCMTVILIPVILLIAIFPNYLGLRQSVFNDVSFGGGIWNIGTIGFGSITWIAIALLNDMTKQQSVFSIISIFVFVFVGISGLSRTILLMGIFSLGCYFLISKKDIKLVLKMLIVLIFVLLYFLIESDIVAELFQRLGDRTSGTNNVRFLLWPAYLSHYKEFWLLGAPLGSVYRYYHDVDLLGRYFLPHSTPINFFVRYGIFALVSYIQLIKYAFLSINTKITNEYYRNCIISGGIAYISLAFINQTGFAEPIFYIMFGLLIAFARIVNSNSYHVEI